MPCSGGALSGVFRWRSQRSSRGRAPPTLTPLSFLASARCPSGRPSWQKQAFHRNVNSKHISVSVLCLSPHVPAASWHRERGRTHRPERAAIVVMTGGQGQPDAGADPDPTPTPEQCAREARDVTTLDLFVPSIKECPGLACEILARCLAHSRSSEITVSLQVPEPRFPEQLCV